MGLEEGVRIRRPPCNWLGRVEKALLNGKRASLRSSGIKKKGEY